MLHLFSWNSFFLFLSTIISSLCYILLSSCIRKSHNKFVLSFSRIFITPFSVHAWPNLFQDSHELLQQFYHDLIFFSFGFILRSLCVCAFYILVKQSCSSLIFLIKFALRACFCAAKIISLISLSSVFLLQSEPAVIVILYLFCLLEKHWMMLSSFKVWFLFFQHNLVFS